MSGCNLFSRVIILIFTAGIPALLTSRIQCQTSAQPVSDEQAAPDKGSSSATILSTVDEVSLDLIVHNKKNKAVLDLKPGDITVTDNGSLASVSDLRLVSGKTAGDHLITFLFDQLGPSSATNARNIAQKTLKMVPESGFRISVLGISGRLHLFQEFTSDREALSKSINAVTGVSDTERVQLATFAEKRVMSSAQSGVDSSGARISAKERSIDQAMVGSLAESQRVLQDRHSQPSLAGLSALARMLTSIPGRKVVVFFTPGLETDPNTGDMLRSIMASANRGGVSFYTINCNGIDPKEFDRLNETMAMGNAMAGSHLNGGASPTGPAAASSTFGAPQAPWIGKAVQEQTGRFEQEGMSGSSDPFAGLSAGTGGAYVGADGNFRKPMRQMIADLSTYYELSYVPHIQQYDRQFHSVAVKPVRKGLRIHSGSGYFAVPPNEESANLEFEAPLLKALAEPQLASDLKPSSRIFHLGNSDASTSNALIVEVPLAQLQSREDLNTNLLSWHVSIVAQIRNKSGAVVQHFSEDIPRRSLLDAKDAMRSEFATMQRHFVAAPGEYTLETAVMDRNSGKLGATRQSITVASPADGPFLSDVAMVRRIDPFPEEIDIFEPLRYQSGKVVPSLSGRVLPGAKDVSFFFLVHPDADGSESPLLQMQVLRNGELLGQMPLQMPKEKGDVLPYLAALRTSSLPAGNYEVSVELTQNGKVAERATSFRIDGPEVASNVGNLSVDKSRPQDAELEAVADSHLLAPELDPGKNRRIVITALSSDSVTRPSGPEIETMIAGARERALNYATKLPNFLCIEVTDRSVDSSGNGRWKHKDSFAELLRYRDNKETRTTLEVNGQRSSMTRDEMGGWPISLGEFGDVLNSVFQPGAKADFKWKETDALGDSTVQVFEYQVARDNASMSLGDSGGRVYAGFHGLAYIDAATLGIRRITMEADNLPKNFSIHAASIAVDYDYVPIGAHEYMMPIRGTISLQRGRHEADLNQIVFQGYKRYAAQTKITATPIQ